MSNWTESDLLHWDEKIIRVARDMGLDWHPIDYEIIDYQEMLGAMDVPDSFDSEGHRFFVCSVLILVAFCSNSRLLSIAPGPSANQPPYI